MTSLLLKGCPFNIFLATTPLMDITYWNDNKMKTLFIPLYAGLGEFEDIESLTMFADYRVPQSLQYFGAMVYSEDLLKVLEGGDLLPNGDPLEVEIRGCSIEAVQRVVQAARYYSLTLFPYCT